MLFYEENPNMYNINQVSVDSSRINGELMMNFNPVKTPRCLIMIILMIILLPGCQIIKQGETPSPTQNSSLPESMLDPSSESNSTPLILSDVSFNDIPSPNLFSYAWQDRTPYEISLVQSSRTTLQERFDRSVYHLVVDIADDYRTINFEGRSIVHKS